MLGKERRLVIVKGKILEGTYRIVCTGGVPWLVFPGEKTG